MDDYLSFVIIGVFLAAGIIKGISGMGLPTIAMALLSFLILPAHAAMLMVIPSLLTNITQCLGKYWRLLLKDHWIMWSAMFLLIIFSPYSNLNVADGPARLFLGLVLIMYGFWGLFKPALPNTEKNKALVGCVVGFLTGTVTAATGVIVLPIVPYLQSLKSSKDAFIQSLGISFTIATIALIIRLGISNTQDWTLYTKEIFIAVIAAFIGMWIGTKFRSQLNPIQFQRFLYAVFIFLGLIMTAKFLYSSSVSEDFYPRR